MNNSDKLQFFAENPKEQITAHVGGKLIFNNLPIEVQKKVKEKLAEKDKVMARGLKGELPGIKIDGEVVTRENLHTFEKGSKEYKAKLAKLPKKVNAKVAKKPKSGGNKLTKESLEKKTFSQLRDIGNKLGLKFRGKVEAIREILGAKN